MSRFTLRANRAGVVPMLLVFVGLWPADARAFAPTEDEEKLVARVAGRLIAVCEPVPGYEWPPRVAIDAGARGINAYATVLRKDDGKLYPAVQVTLELLRKVIQEEPDRLAFVLGHELGHIRHKHCTPKEWRDQTPFLRSTFVRQQEAEADLAGVELLVKAGFSFDRAKEVLRRMNKLAGEASSFEGLCADHPTWNDRLANVARDADEARVWRTMSAFRNGVAFLTTEQYSSAQTCFERVVKDFPSCYEGWVNLGFARLMQYCDKLDIDDLRAFGPGQPLTGGFYRRVQSITVRGRDEKLWWDAVGALREGLRLKPDVKLAKANLGLAYLVHPNGKDVGEATRLLEEAARECEEDRTLDPLTQAELLINFGVAQLGAGKMDAGLQLLKKGERRALAGQPIPNSRREATALAAAVLYNRALAKADGKDAAERTEALALLEKYLKTASSQSLWWPLAYQRYVKLCASARPPRKPLAEEAFKKARPEPLRLVTAVKLKSGKEVTLGEDVKDVVKDLGAGRKYVVIEGTNLRRLRYDKEGVELLVTNMVLAVCLVGADAQELPLRGRGLGADTKAVLRVGMTTKQVEAVLGNEDWHPCELTEPNTSYRYYRDQGLAVRLVKGAVTELVVVQIPER